MATSGNCRISTTLTDVTNLQAVRSSAGDPPGWLPFIYTISNHEQGLPELLMVGEASDLFAQVLNIAGRLQRERGSAFRHEELVDYTARLPAKLVDAGRTGRDEYAVQVGVYYRTKLFEVRQILLPDQNGRYPGEPGCLPPYCYQPVLTDTD